MVQKDSTSHEKVINTGDVQIMSAGTGIDHSEYNFSGSENLNFLQIWIIPKKRDITPRYDQMTFPLKERKNILKTVVSPDGEDVLWINQDAYLTLGQSDQNHTFTYELNKKGNGVYIFVIEGNVKIQDDRLQRRDAIGLIDINHVRIESLYETEFLIIEVPM